jgi:hypothetical protein
VPSNKHRLGDGNQTSNHRILILRQPRRLVIRVLVVVVTLVVLVVIVFRCPYDNVEPKCSGECLASMARVAKMRRRTYGSSSMVRTILAVLRLESNCVCLFGEVAYYYYR